MNAMIELRKAFWPPWRSSLVDLRPLAADASEGIWEASGALAITSMLAALQIVLIAAVTQLRTVEPVRRG